MGENAASAAADGWSWSARPSAEDLARLRALDDAAWNALEREYAGRLLAYVRRRVPDAGACQDVLQETLLGALRGIQRYDPRYSLEQYLFGICRNRTVDHLRRRKLPTLGEVADDEQQPLEELHPAPEASGPARTVVREDLRRRAAELLADTLVAWVEETWRKEAYERLMVVEALLGASWRNKDVREVLGLRDESVVAGIKFRALRRMKELAAALDAAEVLLPFIRVELERSEASIDLDVQRVWRDARVSCPARVWLARYLAEEPLSDGAVRFLEFHAHRLGCVWCQANLDDLAALHDEGDMEPLLAELRRSRWGCVRDLTADA